MSQLSRQELIQVYTSFVAMFLLQECEMEPTDRNCRGQKQLQLNHLHKTVRKLNLQPDRVLEHLTRTLSSVSGSRSVGWAQFVSKAASLIPCTDTAKFGLLLESMVPAGTSHSSFQEHTFSCSELVEICS